MPGVGTTGPTDPSTCPGGICNGGMDMKVANTTDMNPAKTKFGGGVLKIMANTLQRE